MKNIIKIRLKMDFYSINTNLLVYLSSTFPNQGSDEWKELKKGFVSGTKVTSAININSNRKKKNTLTLPSKVFTGNKYTQHGNYFEPIARQIYEREREAFVIELNFIRHKTNPIIGFSPDGWDHVNQCLIEFKCPYSSDLVSKLKIDHWRQMQLGLHVLKSHGIDTYCNYVVYDYKTGKIHVRRVNRDDSFWSTMNEDSIKFLEHVKTHDDKVLNLFKF